MKNAPERSIEPTASAPGQFDPTPVLQLGAITKTFGGYLALNHADFELQKGEVHALLGENGAGKSTLMNVVAGLYAPDHGQIAIHGRPVTIKNPQDARNLRVGMVHQHFKLVGPFTATQNILLANPQGAYRTSLPSIRKQVTEQAAQLDFRIDQDRPVAELSIAEQQRIEILKVLVAGAELIILDEPTAVLTDAESRSLLGAIRNLAEDGKSVVLVTHKLHEALDYCDRVTVMRGGKVVRTVSPDGITPLELTKMIVGDTIVETPKLSKVVSAPRLKVRDVSLDRGDGKPVLSDLNLSVCAGEIYGVAGVGGNGQSELVEILTGMRQQTSGVIELADRGDISMARADQRRAFGIACIPSDRHKYALAGGLSVADNYAVGGVINGAFGSWPKVNRRKMAEATRDAIAKFDVQGVRSARQRAALLSGGNAQKLVIAREFSGRPEVVVAHSPNRGLDVRASAAVHDHLRAARDKGAAVILISEDLDEIMLLSDRIGVMNSGTIVAEFEAPADRNLIGKAMVGHD